MLKTKAPIWMSVNEPLHFRMKRGFVRACVWVLYADATTCMQWPSSNHCLTAMCLHRGGGDLWVRQGGCFDVANQPPDKQHISTTPQPPLHCTCISVGHSVYFRDSKNIILCTLFATIQLRQEMYDGLFSVFGDFLLPNERSWNLQCFLTPFSLFLLLNFFL